MSTITAFPADSSLLGKRIDLIALSKQLQEDHSQILAISKLLKHESEELSKESRLLRIDGHTLARAVNVEMPLTEITRT